MKIETFTNPIVLSFQKKLKETYLAAKNLATDGAYGNVTHRTLLSVLSDLEQEDVLAKVLKVALQEMGVREVRGPEHNPRIIEYHQAVSGKFTSDEIPWCSSFANWCVKEVGNVKLRRTDNGLARSWLTLGKKADECPPTDLKMGSIVVFSRGKSSYMGHVAFLLHATVDRLLVVGGNQSDSVCLATFPATSFLGSYSGEV
jgi:uncharacterized protein (TIGR02594 family)